jgi:hypothetical protein
MFFNRKRVKRTKDDTYHEQREKTSGSDRKANDDGVPKCQVTRENRHHVTGEPGILGIHRENVNVKERILAAVLKNNIGKTNVVC